MKATLIISIYKNIIALQTILRSLRQQTEQDFELIISEDGEDIEVRKFIEQYQFPWTTQHLTQPDMGWQKNKALNRAVLAAQTDWLIFIDGDCVLHPRFVEMHIRYQQDNVLLAGKRIKLNPKLSQQLIDGKKALKFFPYLFNRQGCRYVEEAFFIPLSHWLRRPVKHLVGSNMSMSKQALLSINGFDEEYTRPAVGEDYDIEWRLLAKGYKIVSLRNHAIQYHLYHKENWIEQSENKKYCAMRQANNDIICKNGIQKL